MSYITNYYLYVIKEINIYMKQMFVFAMVVLIIQTFQFQMITFLLISILRQDEILLYIKISQG